MKTYYLVLASLQYEHIGEKIDEGKVFGRYGSLVAKAIALSADGNVLAVGVRDYDEIHSTSGYVKVFHKDDESLLGWSQLGNTLRGDSFDDEFGSSVALSDDGEILAVGAVSSKNDEKGYVRVWQRVNSTSLGWTYELHGKSRNDFFGYSMALSNNGAFIAISAFFGNYARVYRQDVSSALGWTQLGGDILLENYGYVNSISMSDDGSLIAIGSPKILVSGLYISYARVYRYDPKTDLGWIKIGNDMKGDIDDEAGWHVHLSSDGSTLAVAAKGGEEKDGYVQVYELSCIPTSAPTMSSPTTMDRSAGIMLPAFNLLHYGVSLMMSLTGLLFL